MKISIVILVVSLLLVIPSLEAARTPHGRIVGGVATEIANVPYIVSVQSAFFNIHNCGGSIIADTWVVSAAHCTEEGNKKYYVRAGSAFSAEGGITANVIEVINHEDFLRATMDNDIALLKLDKAITGRIGGQIIALPPQGTPIQTGQVVRVSGWGRTNTDKESMDKLRTVEVDIVDFDTCKVLYEEMYDLTKNMVCAARKGKDACQMDSGGPLVLNEKLLVGIVSWGDKCAHETYPGVYTMVSEFRDWIKLKSGV